MRVRTFNRNDLPTESTSVPWIGDAPPAWSEPSIEGRTGARIRQALREAQLGPQSPNPILVQAVLVGLERRTGAQRLALAVADCAVSGRNALRAYEWNGGNDAVSIAREVARLRRQAAPTAAMSDLAQKVVARAREALAYLRAKESQRAALRPRLGWIGVSGEDDGPHRPVNMPSTDLTSDHVEVTIPLEPPLPAHVPRPRRVVTLSMRYALEGPLDGSRPIILFLHGHGSRLEEVEDVARILRDRAQHTIVAIDLPSSGYSEIIDHAIIAHPDAAGEPILEFLDEAVGACFSAIRRAHGAPATTRVSCLAGGSLGGNLALRLGSKKPAWLGGRIAAWSPASVWAPQRLDIVLDRPRSRMKTQEGPGSRREYFRQVFEERVPCIGGQAVGLTQPEMWYRGDWPPMTAHIQGSRLQRQETYDSKFRRWQWRLAYEQLRFSLLLPLSGTPLVDRMGSTKVLLAAGAHDDIEGTNIYSRVRDLGNHFAANNVTGTTLLLPDTGHSIHNERPELLADLLTQFVAGQLDN